MKTIKFTKEKLYDLRGKYQKALHNQTEEFEFEGVKVLTAYAKYLIEYLDMQFDPKTTEITHPLGTDL